MTAVCGGNHWTIRLWRRHKRGAEFCSRPRPAATRKRHEKVPAANLHLVEQPDHRHALRTWRFGKRVGEDELGNVYYEGGMSSYGLPKRWVIYKGYAEASAIPPGWHGWMHHRTDVAAVAGKLRRRGMAETAPRQPDRLAAGLPPAGLARRCRRTSARNRRLRRLDAGQLSTGIVWPVLWPQLTFTRRLAA